MLLLCLLQILCLQIHILSKNLIAIVPFLYAAPFLLSHLSTVHSASSYMSFSRKLKTYSINEIFPYKKSILTFENALYSGYPLWAS